jgi:hypothetical protein
MLFTNNEKMERLQDFKPTSKAQLRQFCMWFAEGDVKKAKDMYDFYADGIDLPDVEPTQPTTFQNVKNTASDVLVFVRDNKDDILTAVGFVKSLLGKGGNAVQAAAEPIAKIN